MLFVWRSVRDFLYVSVCIVLNHCRQTWPFHICSSQNVSLRSSTYAFFKKRIWEWQPLSGDTLNPPSTHAADRLYVSWSLNVFLLGMGRHCIYTYKKKKSTESPVQFPTECKYTLKSFWWIWYEKSVQKRPYLKCCQVSFCLFVLMLWTFPFDKSLQRLGSFLAKEKNIVHSWKQEKKIKVIVCEFAKMRREKLWH